MSPKKDENLSKEKKTALDKAIKQIEKQFGKGSVMLLGEDQKGAAEVIPTGCLALDVALGVGGYPRGRVVEIYGPEASGKTTVALHAIAEAQRNGGLAAFVDAEHALDVTYARNLGIDIDNLLISQPDYGEQALEIVDGLIRSNALDIIVIDSVAALVPRAEIEGTMGDMQVGLQARLMSQALRKIAGTVNKSKTIVVFINQTRMKIGVMYGNPETTTGGVALKFYSSVRLEIRRGSSIKEGDENVGNEVNVKVVKNKVAPPFKKVKVDLIYGKGIVHENELFNLALDDNIIDRKGAWYNYVDEKGNEMSLGQGKSNAIEYLKDNPEILREIENRIRSKNNLPKIGNEEGEKKEENKGE